MANNQRLIEKQDRFLQAFVNRVQNMYAQSGRIPNVIFGLGKNRTLMIPLDYENERERDKAFYAVHRILIEEKIKRYAYICDSWYAPVDPDEPTPFNSLSQHPERQEMMLWGMVSDKGVERAYGQYHDSAQKRFLADPKCMKDDATSLTGFFSFLNPFEMRALEDRLRRSESEFILDVDVSTVDMDKCIALYG